MLARLKKQYQETIIKDLMKQFNYKNIMEVPRIVKITLNMGVGEAAADKHVIAKAQDDLQKISGQKPVITVVKKSNANFKIREGWPIGCKVTLRGDRAYEFLDRLINIAIPRVRDFRGLTSKAFDGTGNYSLGIQEQIVFPEIEYDKIDTIRGLDISITISSKTDAASKALLTAFRFPFKD